MNANTIPRRENPLMALRRLARPRSDVEQCEFCSQPLDPSHRHLLEINPRKIVCVCDPCALRFESVIGRFKLIPRDARRLADFELTDVQWEAFALPIQLAFFFHSTPARKTIALYPSPGGATESLLPLEAWSTLVAANPVLTRVEPDVEALLVNRLRNQQECFIAPIDACFELVGLIRVHWRGFSGGDKAWDEIEKFFARLRVQTAVSAGDALEMEAARA